MNGWLLIDKEEGISSAQALNILKQVFKKQGIRNIKIGHSGTLDPFASGLLVVAIGETTKLIDYVMRGSKKYQFTIKWGEDRDTFDREGVVVNTTKNIPSHSEIEKITHLFKGVINQIPPKYSAISINGKRAYSLARMGIEFELKSRQVELKSLDILSCCNDSTSFEVECGKGFYIRSLAKDLSDKLNTYGYVSELRRISTKKFCVRDAISLDIIRNLLHNVESTDSLHYLQMNLKPQLMALDDILVHEVDEYEAQKLRNGQSIECNQDHLLESSTDEVIITYNNIVLAICLKSEKWLKPRRVLNIL